MNEHGNIKMIPVAKIKVINPRLRNKVKFGKIVTNISNIGLKRPVTVNASQNRDGEEKYDLVCGQGRLEAYIALGQESIPAVVISVSKEDAYLMSLVENCARRKYESIELINEIGNLKKRGYKTSEIAQKIDLHPEYVRGILRLLKRGEERLIHGVEKGYIPISLAMEISGASDEDAQRALLNAYESKKLKGKELIKARRLIDKRRSLGKTMPEGKRIIRNRHSTITADTLVKTYRKEVESQNLLIRKAKLCEARLRFIVSALAALFEDGNYLSLLRSEEMATIPKFLTEKIQLKNRENQNEGPSQIGIQYSSGTA
jgi:ParB family chromosome partitioning protein